MCIIFSLVAPVKALCTEKLHDWARKFARLNINCLEVTGDSDVQDLNYLQRHQLILTTPEKWDSLTRRWRDRSNSNLMKSVRLFLIDEVVYLSNKFCIYVLIFRSIFIGITMFFCLRIGPYFK